MRDDYISDSLLCEKEVARLFSLSIRSLQHWRCNNFGPPFIKINKQLVRYRYGDLIKWVENHAIYPDNNFIPHIDKVY